MSVALAALLLCTPAQAIWNPAPGFDANEAQRCTSVAGAECAGATNQTIKTHSAFQTPGQQREVAAQTDALVERGFEERARRAGERGDFTGLVMNRGLYESSAQAMRGMLGLATDVTQVPAVIAALPEIPGMIFGDIKSGIADYQAAGTDDERAKALVRVAGGIGNAGLLTTGVGVVAKQGGRLAAAQASKAQTAVTKIKSTLIGEGSKGGTRTAGVEVTRSVEAGVPNNIDDVARVWPKGIYLRRSAEPAMALRR